MGSKSSFSAKQIALWLKSKTSIDDNGCWIWNGAIHTVGYPITPAKLGGGRYGHRCMFNAIVAPIPQNMYVLHTCDNRKCVNPEHLFLGTHLDNVKDMHNKKRQRGGSLPGESNPHCKFTDETIQMIRTDHVNGAKKKYIEAKYHLSESHYYRIVKNISRIGG